MYRTRLVKFRSKTRLPAKPQARARALKTSSLGCRVRKCDARPLEGERYHGGSAMPTPPSSLPLPWLFGIPPFGSVILHGDAMAAMAKVLERGPIVAATSGMTVDATHHCLVPAVSRYPARLLKTKVQTEADYHSALAA